jgi:hypothetical protein
MIAFPNSETRNNSQKVKRKSYQKIVPISYFYEAEDIINNQQYYKKKRS